MDELRKTTKTGRVEHRLILSQNLSRVTVEQDFQRALCM
jgi:hypothetical protein